MPAGGSTRSGQDAATPGEPGLGPLTAYTWLSLLAVGLISVSFPLGELVTVALPPGWTVFAIATTLLAGYLQVDLLRRAPGLRATPLPDHPHRLLCALAVVLGLVASLVLWAVAGTGHRVGWLYAMPFGALVAAVLVHRTPSLLEPDASHRPAALVAGASVVGTAAAALVGYRADVPHADVTVRALYGAAVVVAAATLQLGQVWVWQVMQALHVARVRAADLALTNERMRFAAELHDVQGHHLQVIVVTAELAEQLVPRDPQAAVRHLQRIRSLAVTALEDTRAVAYAYRRTSFTAELDNGVAVLRAAGVDVHVHGEPDLLPPEHGSAMGHLVREATTNHLRHSDARECTIEIGHVGTDVVVTVRDPGPARASSVVRDTRRGQGLAGLADRFAAAGGTIEARDTEHGFVLTGRLPRDATARRGT
ncbi:sensor histidine kinase [Cellulomonas sp. CW35]|uniref:sensor histidine kinase n=1 Tax=unclassified Cellulomonas TaxID=2620175 RepID=UPI000B8D5DCE|nr:histidine kinase [Cellulomonas sp. PSBB021]ASR56094.1 hypothetical protein CBP52_14425 [Cellulomonas sp. PSBB021]